MSDLKALASDWMDAIEGITLVTSLLNSNVIASANYQDIQGNTLIGSDGVFVGRLAPHSITPEHLSPEALVYIAIYISK